MYRSNRKLPAKAKTLIYHSLFRPYLTYGLAHYADLNRKEINKLQTLQDKALKVTFDQKSKDDLETYRKKFKILTVDDEVILARIQLAATIADPSAPRNIRTLLSQTTQRTTRHNEGVNFELPKWKKTGERRTSTYMIPYTYNALHSSTKELPIHRMTRHVKNSLLGLSQSE